MKIVYNTQNLHIPKFAINGLQKLEKSPFCHSLLWFTRALPMGLWLHKSHSISLNPSPLKHLNFRNTCIILNTFIYKSSKYGNNLCTFILLQVFVGYWYFSKEIVTLTNMAKVFCGIVGKHCVKLSVLCSRVFRKIYFTN